MSRRRRLLLRILLVLVGLGLLLLLAFTWLLYWPFEGRVDRIEALVPRTVDFACRTSWKGLKETGWFQQNILERPVAAQIEEKMDSILDGLDAGEEFNSQINAMIPLGLATFSLEDDVFGDEHIFAGRYCEEWDPQYGLPRVPEWLFLTRTTWKPKFLSALKHGFIRSKAEPAASIDALGDGIYKILVRRIAPGTVQQRTLPAGTDRNKSRLVNPYNVFYLFRERDVLAISNTEELIRDVADRAAFPDDGRGYVDRPQIHLEAQRGTVAASMDVEPLHYYLQKLLENSGEIRIFRRYLTMASLHRLNARLEFQSPDDFKATAAVRYQPSELAAGVRQVYDIEPEEMESGIADLVPGDDTFGVLLLRTPPLQLIKGIYYDILRESDRTLWKENLRRLGRDESIEEFFAAFAEKLDDTAGIAVGRMSELFDRLDPPGFDADPKDYPDPNWPALTLVARLRHGTSAEDMDAYLAERIGLLGADPDLEKVTHRGLEYTRIRLRIEAADYALFTPCFILAQRHLIFSSNEDYFRKILDTIAAPEQHPPLSADPTFRSVLVALREKDDEPLEAHLALFVDLEKLLRVPPDTEPGGQPRGYLWDRRNVWVVMNRDAREEAKRLRQQLQVDHMKRAGRPPTVQQDFAIEERVAKHVLKWEGRYAEFEEEYRQMLADYGHLRAFGLGIVSKRPTLGAKLVFQLVPQGR